MKPRLSALDDDPGVVRTTFAQFPSGVVVLAVEREGERHALVASSFMVGVSLRPCLVAVAVRKSSRTWERIGSADAIGVSILASGQGALTRRLASADRSSRFEQVAVDVDDSCAVFIEDAAVWLTCSPYQVTEAGDHWLALLEVTRAGVSGKEPLIWHGARFRELVADDSIDITGVIHLPAAAWTP